MGTNTLPGLPKVNLEIIDARDNARKIARYLKSLVGNTQIHCICSQCIHNIHATTLSLNSNIAGVIE